MTARELYDCDTTFRLLVDLWVRERRCPLPLVDRCLDFGLESQADCARWAATEPDRPGFYAPNRFELMGVFPAKAKYEGAAFRWFTAESDTEMLRAHWVCVSQIKQEPPNRFDTAPDAILWLLDNWKPS